jgi:hypothetical protein
MAARFLWYILKDSALEDQTDYKSVGSLLANVDDLTRARFSHRGDYNYPRIREVLEDAEALGTDADQFKELVRERVAGLALPIEFEAMEELIRPMITIQVATTTEWVYLDDVDGEILSNLKEGKKMLSGARGPGRRPNIFLIASMGTAGVREGADIEAWASIAEFINREGGDADSLTAEQRRRLLTIFRELAMRSMQRFEALIFDHTEFEELTGISNERFLEARLVNPERPLAHYTVRSALEETEYTTITIPVWMHDSVMAYSRRLSRLAMNGRRIHPTRPAYPDQDDVDHEPEHNLHHE